MCNFVENKEKKSGDMQMQKLYELKQDIILQVKKKFCELKRGNIGIVEKAQETRFGMSPKYLADTVE